MSSCLYYYSIIETNTPEDKANYVNYMSFELDDWTTRYWGENYGRLMEIKAKYDPNGMFTKKFTVGARQQHRHFDDAALDTL